MTEIQHITWLIGSPKAQGSTSEALGAYFTSQFDGAAVSRFQAHKVIRRQKDTVAFLNDLDNADLFVVSFPLYVDALPYVLTKTLEWVLVHRETNPHTKSQRLVCIANCGFPEAHHNQLALEMCQVFAKQSRFAWAGGIAIGAGGAIGGRPLDHLGKMVENYRNAFDEAAQQIIAGEMIHEETIAHFARPVIPNRLYTGLGTVGWMMQARQHGGNVRDLWRTPYTTN